MNDDAVADLKQFIAHTVKTEVQTAVDIQVRAVVKEEVRAIVKDEVRAVVKEELVPINQKIDDLTDFVRESLDITNESTGEQLADHETRITKLEQAAA